MSNIISEDRTYSIMRSHSFDELLRFVAVEYHILDNITTEETISDQRLDDIMEMLSNHFPEFAAEVPNIDDDSQNEYDELMDYTDDEDTDYYDDDSDDSDDSDDDFIQQVPDLNRARFSSPATDLPDYEDMDCSMFD